MATFDPRPVTVPGLLNNSLPTSYSDSSNIFIYACGVFEVIEFVSIWPIGLYGWPEPGTANEHCRDAPQFKIFCFLDDTDTGLVVAEIVV